ncbi:MAG: GNAT superfamily N-acetyltransferase, partial [Saprospiraceae bacterium]
AQLKYHEMSIYPDKENWLGGVYVSKNYRGKGIARQIIQKLIVIAGNLNIKKLYLQTENLDGGLYQRMGWKPIEQVNYHNIDVLVMERDIKV